MELAWHRQQRVPRRRWRTAANGSAVNQNFPNPGAPNNVLAPFWADLDPTAGGAVRINTLTNGTDTWIVTDWDHVRVKGSSDTETFEVWIRIQAGLNPGEQITFSYSTIVMLTALTVGAEDISGTVGANWYYNGTGSNVGNDELSVAYNGPVVTPLPAALPLFASGLGAMGFIGWRRKRKVIAA